MKEILEVRNLCKLLAGNITAAENVSFSILEGEFVTLLGPSGCGKTTTLRMIAGFEYPDSGQVILDNREVTYLAPYKRPVNMMFQDFALWPHMTVARNIAYGLTISGVDKKTIQSEVSQVLDLVDLKAKANSFGRTEFLRKMLALICSSLCLSGRKSTLCGPFSSKVGACHI